MYGFISRSSIALQPFAYRLSIFFTTILFSKCSSIVRREKLEGFPPMRFDVKYFQYESIILICAL